MEKKKVLDLFSGIGGFSLGLERTGHYETTAFCEIDQYAQKVLQKHWPEVPIYNDVETADFGSIGPVDLVTAGFPCQDISLAGEGAGLAGERSGLFWHILRTVRLVGRPKLLLENVAALLSRGMGEVCGALAQVGYDTEWHCIPSSAVGGPTGRDRVWIIADPSGVGQQGQGGCIKSIDQAPERYREASGLIDAFQRDSLPFVCRGHDRIPAKLAHHANRQYGNSVDPTIVEMIGRAMEEERQRAGGEEERRASPLPQ